MIKTKSRKKAGLLLPVFIALASLPGCNNDHVPDATHAISFEALTHKSLMRAAATTGATIEDFSVFAMLDGAASLANLQGVKVSRSDNGWTYSPAQFWPLAGSIDFYAYSPYASTGVTVNYSAADVSDLSLNYAVASDPAQQEDFLVAVKTGIAVDQPMAVNLHFQHVLSRIRLKARSRFAGVSYKIYGVSFLNLKDEGKLALTPTNIPSSGGFTYEDDVTKPYTVLWTSADAADASYVFDFSAEPIVVNNSSVYTDVIDDALMVLPQQTALGGEVPTDVYVDGTHPADPADGKLYVKLIYGNASHSDKIAAYFPVKEPLDPTDNRPVTFEAGRQYTFTVELVSFEKIAFDVTVSDFDKTFSVTGTTSDPDPAKTSDYKPQAHAGWAGSNIYWRADPASPDGGYLTFDDVGETSSFGGLFFKWGSLIAISPKGALSTQWYNNQIIYTPTGRNGNYRSQAASTAALATWGDIPIGDFSYLTHITQDELTSGYITYLNSDRKNFAEKIGDICAYLSGRPGVPEGYWRMPTGEEFGDDAQYFMTDSFVLTGESVDDGTSLFEAGCYYNYDGKHSGASGVFFPASGLRFATTGIVNLIGTNAYAWSSSPKGSDSFCLCGESNKSVKAHIVFPRPSAMPVRCVKKQ
jgi:hypothetical protein